MKIDNTVVANLVESIVSSGFPMLVEYDSEVFRQECERLHLVGYNSPEFKLSPHYLRCVRLCVDKLGSGHDNFLSGIFVSCNITGVVKWWEQFQRYHFKQIVSSQSTMHRLKAMISSEHFGSHFSPCVSGDILEMYIKIAREHMDDIEWLSYNCPMGLELTARVTFNYLQLRTIWQQRCRHRHKLNDWLIFGSFVNDLPLSDVFIKFGSDAE